MWFLCDVSRHRPGDIGRGALTYNGGMRRGLAVAAVVVAAACSDRGGGSGDAEPGPSPIVPFDVSTLNVSGSRLRAVYLDVGGQRRFTGWFDRQLGLSCEFAFAADGRWRCLPPAAPWQSWRDPACLQRSIPAEPACADRLVRTYDSDGRPVVRRLGAPVSGEGAYEKLSTDGPPACVAHPQQATATVQVFARGQTVGPQAFVARTPGPDERIETGSRLAYGQSSAEDGSKQWNGLYNRHVQEPCEIGRVASGRFHCLPIAAWIPDNTFANPGCTRRAIPASWPDGDARPRFASRNVSTRCATELELFAIEDPVEGNVIYERSDDGQCEPLPVPPGRYHQVAATATDPGQFEEFVPLPAPGRLRPWMYVSKRGVVYDDALVVGSSGPPRFDDQHKQETCSFRPTRDGKLRCVPPEAPPVFADSACTLPAILDTRRAYCDTYNRVATVASGPWCAPIARVYALGSLLDEVFRRNPAGICVPFETGQIYYKGVLQDDAEFEAAQQLIE